MHSWPFIICRFHTWTKLITDGFNSRAFSLHLRHELPGSGDHHPRLLSTGSQVYSSGWSRPTLPPIELIL